MITVLLASFNGEKYIEEQLNSIFFQTIEDIRVVVRDDCSTDGTWAILERYQKDFPQNLILTRNNENSGNPKFTFPSLMAQWDDDYVMLSDQDDRWMADKAEVTLAKMREMEQVYGKDTPLLVHTDLRVVDETLNVIAPSFREAMNANYDKTALHQLLVQNTLTGCTVMYNRALSTFLRNPPESYIVMHDWYLALIASAFGKIGHLNRPTIDYRQHGSNEIGAKDVRTLSYKLGRLLNGGEVREAIRQSYRQAETFLTQYGPLLSHEQTNLVRSYCHVPSLGKLSRCAAIFRLGTMKNGLSRKIAHFLFV